MGQSNSNFELASEARRAAERFDECEIKVIKETFKDLCQLNGGSMRIDKETFLQYLPLPGLLGERLFAVFDKKNSGEIDYEEFVCGLAVTCRGSWDEKAEFIFNIYDMHGQGAVNREELAALLNHVPKSIMNFGRAVSLDAVDHHDHSHHVNGTTALNNGHQHRPRLRRTTTPSHQHPPPSSAGTVSALSDRYSPERTPRGEVRDKMPLGQTTRHAMVTPFVKVSQGVTGINAGDAGAGGVPEAAAAAIPAAASSAQAREATGTVVSKDGGEHGTIPGGGESGGGDEVGGAESQMLTSGNLRQLHLASISSPVGEKKVMAANDAEGGDPGIEGDHGAAATADPPPPHESGDAVFMTPGERKADGASPTASATSAPSVTASVGTAATTVMTTEAAAMAAAAAAAAVEEAPRETGHHGAEATAPAEYPTGQGFSTAPPGDAQETCGVLSADRVMGVPEGVGGPSEVGILGPGSGSTVGGVRGGGGSTPSAAGPGMHVDGGTSGKSRHNTLHSDASTDDGTSAAGTAPYWSRHWEEFTNNDIVDQAFEDCDLNHNGQLSFSEFRLWVARNPIVTQFLQSVFPYDEHREWGDDRKHLPFIHNREFTGSPLVSDAGNSSRSDSQDDEARRLLVKARDVTRDLMLREGISRLLEQASIGGEGASGEHGTSVGSVNGLTCSEGLCQNGKLTRGSSRRSSTGNLSGGVGMLSELSPRSAKAMQHQTVAKQGFLWKQGYRLRTWKQRWYVLVGNCIYYYQHEDDVYPCGVMFLTGSFVEPLQDGGNERKGYWGIEVSRNHEQNHRRKLYTRSKVEQMKWVKELRKASAVVPIEDDFEIGEELGKGRFSRVCMCVNKHTLERKAVKIIMKDPMKAEEKDLLRAEIAIMKLVNHPNIIRMEAVYESKKDIYIVMELHYGGELFDRIVGRPRFTEDEAFTIVHPLVESVAYLHEMGIVHRDLKPENILCGTSIGDIKIADFGLSKMVIPDEIMKMPCGTLTYVAPEVLTLNGYSKEADMWSVGTIMYLLLRGRLPFGGETREEIIENTIHGTIAWENDHVWAAFSEDGKDLVLGMLNKTVSQRYKAKDVLRHPWITRRQQRRQENPDIFEF